MLFQKGKPNLRLRDERLRHHWSQQELADMIGATLNTVSRWERGLTDCSPYFRNKLCELFGKDARKLGLQDDGQPESPPPVLADPLLPAASKLVGRESLLSQLRSELCSLHEGKVLTLVGMAGVGKSALALALAHDPQVRERFYEGILWVDAGPAPDLVATLSRWGGLLGVEATESEPLVTRQGCCLPALRQAIGRRRMLILLDNLWRLEDALPLLHVGGPYCSYLVTTRSISIALHTASERTINLSELNEAQGLELLERLAPTVVKEEPQRSLRLVQLVGGLPLGLVLMGQYLRLHGHSRQPRRVQLALEWLYQPENRLQLEQPQVALERSQLYSTCSLEAAIALSEEQVSQQAREALRKLSLFAPRPNSFSEQAALAVTGAGGEVFDQLTDAGLLESIGPERYSLHRCIADYARRHVERQEAERRFMQYYLELLERGGVSEQELINVLAALVYACKQGMDQAREALVMGFFKNQNSGLGGEALSTAVAHLSLSLWGAGETDALVEALHHLGEAGLWYRGCDCPGNNDERASRMLLYRASMR